MTEDEMVGRHQWFNEHEFEQAPGDGERTGTPGVLQSMGLRRGGRDWATEQQQQKMDMRGKTGDNQVELGIQLMVFNTNIKFLILTRAY